MFYKSGTNIISVGKPNVSSADYTWSGIDTNWHMWTYVASSSQGGKLYLDGNPTPVATDVNTTALVNPAGDTLPVGAYTSSGALQSGWYGDATIDELGFFSVPLTTSDISSLYNGGVGRSLSSTSVASSSAASYVPLLDPAYDPLPSLPQGALPAISYPFATSSVSTSTLTTLTVATTTTTTTYTPFSGYSDSSSTVTTYITLNGTLVGTYSYQKGNEASSGKLTYTLTNYLGTPVLQADDKGDILEMDITDVFGNYVQRDQRKDGAYHNKGYTGHEFDDTAGLIYAHARYLSAPMHTFLSVDPMLYRIPQSYLYDPQQMNSYAYARNNPVVMMDPNGLSILSSIKSFIGSVVSLTKSALTATAKTVSNRVVEIATSQKTIGVINGATQQTADMGSSIMYLSAGAVNYASGGNCSTCVAMQQQLINSGPLIPTTNINTSSPTYQGALFVGSMFEPSSGGPEGVVEKAAAKQAAKILEASGLGSTAKKQITTLSESILMRAVKDNPLLGNLIPGMSPLKDSRWVGWLKYEFKTKTNNGEDIIIHYNVLKDEFGKLMAVDDFKLK
jgi:RHS repeat-associated protein